MVSGDRQHAAKLRQEVAAVLAPLGLRLAPEKTRVVHIDEGFDFLGYHIRRMRKRGTDKYYVYTKPARKAVQAIKDKVKAKTYRSTRRETLPLPQQQHPDPMDPGASSRHQQLTSGQDPWSARCLERGTPGGGGDPQETDGWQHQHRARGLPHHASLRTTLRTLAPMRAAGHPFRCHIGFSATTRTATDATNRRPRASDASSHTRHAAAASALTSPAATAASR